MYIDDLSEDFLKKLGIKHGPLSIGSNLPMWVVWKGKKYYTPQFRTIEKWMMEGTAKSLKGRRVYELDGNDEKGCPSWIRALGLV